MCGVVFYIYQPTKKKKACLRLSKGNCLQKNYFKDLYFRTVSVLTRDGLGFDLNANLKTLKILCIIPLLARN